MAGGGQWYDVGLNTQDFDVKARHIRSEFDNIGKSASKTSSLFKDFAKGLAGALTVQQATVFAKKVAQVRGEMQQLEVAYRTMLGSKELADKLLSDSINLAATTPFDLQSVAGGTKQLLAYGFAAEDITRNIVMLGNVASGVSAPLNDILYLYGTLKAQGVAMTKDIMQFANRGIPIYEELSKVLKVSTSEVREYVSSGKVGFKEVEQAFIGMTSAGGKFNNLMSEQSKTISGQISNLGDAIYQMFNDIGKSSEGVIGNTIEGLTYLVENYKKVGRAVAELIAIYGTYRAVMMTMQALRVAKIAQLRLMVKYKQLEALQGRTATAQEAAAAVQTNLLTMAKRNLVKAIKDVGKAMFSNPYAIIAIAVTALAYATYRLLTAKTKLQEAQKLVNDTGKEYLKSVKSEQYEIDVLFAKLRTATKGSKEYDEAKRAIYDKYGNYLSKLGDEKTALADVALAYRTISEEAEKSAKARAMASGMDEANKKWVDDVEGGLNKLKKYIKQANEKKHGKNADYFTELEYQSILPILKGDKGQMQDLNPLLDRYKSEMGISFRNKVAHAIYDVGEANNALSSTKTLLTDLFGEQKKGTQATKEAVDEYKLWQEQVKETTNSIATLDKQIAELTNKKETDKGKDGKYYAKQIAELKEKKKEYQETLNRLTGVDAKEKKTKQDKPQKPEVDEYFLKDLLFDNRELELKLQDETAETMLKKIELDWELRNQAIEKKIKEREEYYKKESEYQGKTVVMPEDERSAFVEQKRLSDAYKDYQRKELEKSENEKYKQLLDKYADYERKKQLLAEEFQKELTELNKKGNTAEATRAIAELRERYKKEQQKLIDEEVNEVLLVSPQFEALLRDVSTMTDKSVNKTLKQIEQLLKAIKGEGQIPDFITPENFEKLKASDEALEKLYAQYFSLINLETKSKGLFGGFKDGIDKLKKARELLQQAQSETDTAKRDKIELQALKEKKEGIEDIIDTAGKLSNMLGGVADAFGNLAEAMGDDEMARMANGLMQVAEAAGNIAQGFATGGTAGGAIATITNVFNIISSQVKKSAEERKKFAEDTHKHLENLRMLEIQTVRNANANNIYANSLMKAVDAYNATVVALGLLNKQQGDLDSSGNYFYGHRESMGLGRDWQVGTTMLEQLKQMRLRVGEEKKKFLGITYSKTVKYANIQDLYPDLFKDGQAMPSVAELQKVLSDPRLEEAQRKLVEDVLKIAEAYEEAEKAIDSFTSEMAGGLANTLMDTLVNAISQGADAWEEFRKAGSKAIMDLIKQAVYMAYFSKIFNDFQDKMRDTFSKEQDPMKRAQMQGEAIDWLIDNVMENAPLAEMGLKTALDKMKNMGFEFEETKGSGYKGKGLETITQVQAEELNGRFAAIQLTVYNIDNLLRTDIVPDMREVRVRTTSIADSFADVRMLSLRQWEQLIEINKNTRRLETIEVELVKIRKKTDLI